MLQSLTCGDPSDPWSLVFLASLFFFLWRGLDSRIISSSSNVGSQFSLRLCRETDTHTGTHLKIIRLLYCSYYTHLCFVIGNIKSCCGLHTTWSISKRVSVVIRSNTWGTLDEPVWSPNYILSQILRLLILKHQCAACVCCSCWLQSAGADWILGR